MSRTPAAIALQQAQILVKQYKYAEAIPYLQQALTVAPNLGVWGMLSYALFETERYEEALSACDKAISRDPGALRRGDSRTHANRVLTLIQLKRFDEALAVTDDMLAQASGDSMSWMCHGLALARLNQYGAAEEALLTAVGMAPMNSRAVRELSEFYRQNREYDHAMDACERLLELRQNDAGAWDLKGKILIGYRRYQEVVAAEKRALDCKMETVLGRSIHWGNYGLALIFVGRFNDALAAFDQGEAFAPVRAPQLNCRGVLYSRIERHAEALTWYEAAVKRDPYTATWSLNKAETLVYLGRYDEAESTLDDALSLEPKSFGALCVKGLLETRRGHYDEAMAAFGESIQLDPRHGPTYMELASLLLPVDDAEHACQMAERATTLDPYLAHAWKVNAQALRAAGKLEEAAEAERHGAELLAEQTAQVDAYLQAKQADGGS
jgi:tetratricopeptide (TPR) repeat protein